MPTVTVIGHVRDEGLRVLRSKPGLEIDLLKDPGPAEILAVMPRRDAILVRTARITGEIIGAAPSLRVVSRHGVGYDNVDLDALNARRIPLTVAATANAVSVAEQAIFMMLELMKQGRGFDGAMRGGDWSSRNRLKARELAGRTLVIVGFGRIGRRVAARARSFEMSVLVVDPFVPRETVEAAGCAWVENLAQALPQADVLTLHCPLDGRTRRMIDRAALSAMQPEAILVNTARGGLVDEDALAEALQAGRLAGAGLDVFESEPPDFVHPLFKLPNILVAPHIAGVTTESMVRMAVESAENVLAALEGRLDPAVVINPEVL